jgi:hypothetical protein
MEYVGIDIHKNQSQICLFTEVGEVLHQRLHCQPQAMTTRSAAARRNGAESCTLSASAPVTRGPTMKPLSVGSAIQVMLVQRFRVTVDHNASSWHGGRQQTMIMGFPQFWSKKQRSVVTICHYMD